MHSCCVSTYKDSCIVTYVATADITSLGMVFELSLAKELHLPAGIQRRSSPDARALGHPHTLESCGVMLDLNGLN